jgi:hypothetical protein
MKPIAFKEATNVLQRPESMSASECGPLAVWSDGMQCVSCWRLTWRERISALLFGTAWVAVHFGRTQPPVYAAVTRRYFRQQKDGESTHDAG